MRMSGLGSTIWDTNGPSPIQEHWDSRSVETFSDDPLCHSSSNNSANTSPSSPNLSSPESTQSATSRLTTVESLESLSPQKSMKSTCDVGVATNSLERDNTESTKIIDFTEKIVQTRRVIPSRQSQQRVFADRLDATKKMCSYWLHGTCMFGISCRNVHGTTSSLPFLSRQHKSRGDEDKEEPRSFVRNIDAVSIAEKLVVEEQVQRGAT